MKSSIRFNVVWFCLAQQLCSPQNVNCRDLEGRHSTPLHFAAGYNRVAVVEYFLHHGADVHAKDKGWDFLPFLLRNFLRCGVNLINSQRMRR